MAKVTLEQLVKHYPGNAEPTVCGIDLEIADREFVALVGPSGCGKSTVLRMIAGLEDVTSGELRIGDRRVNDLPPKERNIAMVFQNYALFPHLTVRDNLAFGMKVRRVPRAQQDEAIGEAARMLGLEPLLQRKPGEMSGGQRQRVAIGRALVRKPEVFLFDEPLSNLDAKLRGQMRAEIIRLHRQLETTMIYVTHDQVEAMTMADRIVVFEGGVIQQVGTPAEVYQEPANRFVAGFIGSPTMNFLEGRIEREGERATFVSARAGGLRLPLEGASARAPAAGEIALGVRPENVYFSASAPKDVAVSCSIEATIDVVEYFGMESSITVRIGGDAGDALVLLVKGGKARAGDRVDLVCDLAHLRFFAA